MARTAAERLASLRNHATLYELAITRGDCSYLIAYCGSRSRNTIFKVIADPDRVQKIMKLTGSDRIHYGKRTEDGGMMGEWKVAFTGRTEREAIATESELPPIRTLEI